MEPRTVYILALVVFGIISVDATISVDTGVGRIVGSEESISARGKQFQLKTFLGIPYAKPPTGDLRWQKPVPADNFKGPFMATQYGPVCSQLDSPIFSRYEHQSEDCLSLNIYVPGGSADKDSGHAVMVFIHGGGFEMGSGSSYVSDKLSVLGNVIVVTINYRIGIFGFLSTGDSHIPGNMGMFDQHLALKWVNQNIEAFGGDTGRVTIFGESAGGTSVLYQGLFPENKGLFQRIISESGVPSMAGAINMDPKPQFDFVVKGFGCDAGSLAESIQCLKEKDTDTILKTLEDLIAGIVDNPANALFVHFLITTDGTFVDKDSLPFEIGIKSKTEQLPSVDFFRSLDLMIGYNSYDGAFLIAVPGFLPIPDIETFLPSREEFANQLIHMPLGFYFGGAVPSLITSLVVSKYTDWSNPNAPETNRDNYIQLWTDIFFAKGSNEYARMHANATNSAETFLYMFSAPTSLHAIATPSWIQGANHGDELGFVFGFDEHMIKAFIKSLSAADLNDWEWELSDQIIQYWSNFAKSANPNEPRKSNPTWPQFDLVEQIAMNLEKDMSEESPIHFFYAEKNNFWMETLPAVADAIKQRPEASSPYSEDKNSDGTCDSDKGCGNN